FGDALAHADPFRFADFFAQLDRHGAKVRRARVERFVNTMPDPHDFLFLRKLIVYIRVHLVFASNFFEHVNDAFICAAVQRTLERADRGRDRGIEIGQCGYGHARAEGRRIHAVVRMQNKGNIERVARLPRLRLAAHEVEEMLGFREIVSHWWKRFAVARAMKISGDHADLPRNRDRATPVDFRSCVPADVRVVEPQHRDGGAHYVHRQRVERRSFSNFDYRLWDMSRLEYLTS